MPDDRTARMLEREARQACGDSGPTIHGAPAGWWEEACRRVGEVMERHRREADQAGAKDQA